MDILIRLNILLENNVITEEVYYKIKEIIRELKEKYNVEITEENGGMFITHLSAALTRINNGQPLEIIDEGVMEQIKLESCYTKTVEVMKRIQDICNVVFPREEEIFILTYLCTILS